jgi:cellulose synthase/poly-beta-1,6-N-acetylglucosamine synthase-like glycosyltransferase
MTALAWVVTLAAIPLLVVLIDTAAAMRSSRAPGPETVTASVDAFEILVPIWGSVRYLTNIDFLSPYGQRVVLCTPRSESQEFHESLKEIADEHGFRIFATDVKTVSSKRSSKRQTSGTIRDALVRDAHSVLSRPYVVCIDADTRTREPLDKLVGRIEQGGYDIVSIRVIPANVSNWLTRLQVYEYRLAMRLRLVMPWLVSGACHAGRREAHRAVMRSHSLFFQGNDVEVGWLAERMGYRIGHVQFDVLTDVPDTIGAWWRQRVAWAGGEIRLFLANPQLVLRHPILWTYFAGIVFLLLPLRWAAVASPGWPLAAAFVGYLLVLALVHRRHCDQWIVFYPFYAAATSLLFVPIGIASYLRMAFAHRNAGLIRVRRGRSAPRHAAQPISAGAS